MQCRISLIAAAVFLVAAFPGRALAQALEEVSVERIDDTAKVRVSFSAPVQVTRYFPETAGKILYISVRLTQLGDRSDVSFRQRISSIDRLGGNLPLRDVTFEPNSDEGDRIIVRFSRSVSYKLQRGRDGRSIVVLVPISKRAPEPVGGVNENFPYVINLDSQRTPIGSVKPLPIDTATHRIYVSQYRKGDSLWYRLRVGFFPDKKSALGILNRVRHTYQRAWVTKVSRAERVASRRQQIVSDAGGTTAIEKLSGHAQQMKIGRQALIRGDNKTAIAIFRKIAGSGDPRFSRDALELLGLAYERAGNGKLAVKTYERYINKYPKGDDTSRVKQRLANLSRFAERAPLRAAKPKRGPGTLQTYGTWSQRWYTGTSTAAGSSNVDQSSVLSNLYVNTRYSTEKTRFRATLNADHTWDLLNSASTDGDVRHAYVEAKAKDSRYEARLGRQSGNARGILTRFDGIIGGYNVYRDWRLYVASGAPVDLTATGSGRSFQGVSIDTRIPSKDLSMTLFKMDATIDGQPDRQAIGMEARYFNSDSSGLGLLDYDSYFNELNILLLQANWKGKNDLTYNVVVDYRKSPLLQLSNVLLAPINGVTYDSISALSADQPGVDIYQAAKDRTATSRSLAGGVTKSFSKTVQVSGDLSLSDVSGIPASEGQPAVAGTGLLTTLSGRVIANNWLLKNSVTVAGVSRIGASDYVALSVFATERARFKRAWRMDANVRMYLVNYNNGTSQFRLTPAVRVEYHKNSKTFEFELGRESVDNTGTIGSATERTFINAGYRLDF